MRALMALAASVLLLAACAGTHSTMLSDNMALISVIGNGPADRERVIEESIVEAGKLTRAHGYQYFILLKAEDASVSGTTVRPDLTFANQTSHEKSFGNTNLSTPNISGAIFTTPGKNVPYVKPGLDITIRMYRQGEIDPRMKGLWNADGTMALPPEDKPPPAPQRGRRSASALRG